MYITAYSAVIEPRLGRLPVEECIESLYDHVDAFVILDCSKYDKIDLSKYEKVRKHIKGVYNPFDNPFGSLFNSALKLVDSDTALFLDIDEIFDFKKEGLREIAKRYPLEQGAGIAFPLRNYYCSRNYLFNACSHKGAHLFRNRDDLYHDLIAGFWVHHNTIRRTTPRADTCDGVRLCNGQGQPLAHWEPLKEEEVVIHHTSHLCPVGKMVRSFLQYNHTSTLDLKDFYPFDMRLRPDLVNTIYELGDNEVERGEVFLYTKPIPFEYEKNELLEKFIDRVKIKEFDPTQMVDYQKFES
jgi:hypothetical protein